MFEISDLDFIEMFIAVAPLLSYININCIMTLWIAPHYSLSLLITKFAYNLDMEYIAF